MNSKATGTQPVQIGSAMHAALIAKLRELQSSSLAGAKRVTLRSMIEAALVARWPDLRDGADQAIVSAIDAERSAVFDRIVAAVFGAPAAAIEALDGEVTGSAGQPIRLRDLAYRLKATSAPIGSIDDLLADYERGAK